MKSLIDTVEIKPYVGHGGKREGAGRPPQVKDSQVKQAQALAKQLQAAVKLGLSPLLREYPDLIERAIKVAKAGDNKVLMFLIALPLKMANLDELRDDTLGNSIIKEALAGRQVNIQINNMERVPGPVIDATWREADEGATDGDAQSGVEGTDIRG